LVKVVAILGVINRLPVGTPVHYVFCYPAIAHVSTHSVNLAFGPNVELGPGSGLRFRASAGFGLQNEVRLQLWTSSTIPYLKLCIRT